MESLTVYGRKTDFTYDHLNRLQKRQVLSGDTVEYEYNTTSDGNATMQVSNMKYTRDGKTLNFTYSYDAAGNITKESNPIRNYDVRYTYDSMNRLISEAVNPGGIYQERKDTYTYDGFGNIRTKVSEKNGSTTKTNTYTYGNTSWRDLLTAYNGNSITYDTIGNPTKYYNGTSFTWTRGRQLSKAVNTAQGQSVDYTYDVDGTRIGKAVTSGGTTTAHKYYVQDSKVVAEDRGGVIIEYLYGDNGLPLYMIYNGYVYTYVTNQQGDVVQLWNRAKGGVVATYEYNAYGELLYSEGKDNIHEINPLRYRGYYCDTETGLYYLNSRYYDPVTCRFINADGYVSTGQGLSGNNMFSYCGNNPVMYL